jgi:WD40 repeat protein
MICARLCSAVTAVCLSADGDTLFSVSQDASLKIYSRSEKRQLRSVNVCELALSALALSRDGRSVFVSSWDNNVYDSPHPHWHPHDVPARCSCPERPCGVAWRRYVYNVDYGRILDTLSGHDDAVSSLRLRDSTLVTASWDSTIKVRGPHTLPPCSYCTCVCV